MHSSHLDLNASVDPQLETQTSRASAEALPLHVKFPAGGALD